MPTYHYVQNQEKLIIESWEMATKFNLGNFRTEEMAENLNLGNFFDDFEAKYLEIANFSKK